MKKLSFVVLLIVPVFILGMDAPLEKQAPSEGTKQLFYSVLPKDVCGKIAAAKTAMEPIALTDRRNYVHNRSYWGETLRMSASWNTLTLIPRFSLWEHQLWYCSSHTRMNFRFDNDTSHDCNEFSFNGPRLNSQVFFDGPNNDGGRHNGIILVGHTFDLPTDKNPQAVRQTKFYLFKQHGVHVAEYKGVQKRIETGRMDNLAIQYQEFPYVSEPLEGHTLEFCALAPHKRGLIATTAMGNNHLHVFNFESFENETDKTKPDQSFKVAMLARAAHVPLFSRLAWIYGRTLLGITDTNELYVIALEREETTQPRITCYKQKTLKKFKNFCLGRPDDHHKVLLCDTENNLYTVNLKHRSATGAYVLKPLMEKIEAKKEAVKLEHAIDRLWAYDGKVAAMELRSAECTFFNMLQATWTSEMINKELHELKKRNQVEQIFEEYTLELQKES